MEELREKGKLSEDFSEDSRLDKEIREEALRWVKNNKSLEICKGSYTSPRISSEIPDCSMPLSFDSYKFCSFGCQYCVISGTYINLKGGKKPIEEIKTGDKVYSYNIETKKVELETVLNTMSRQTTELLEIELENGKKITITPEHPVYVADKGWVDAKDLKENDDVIFMKNAAISYSMSKNNPMKNPEIAKKVGVSMKSKYDNGELEELRSKLSSSAKKNILKWNSSEAGRKAVSERMKKNNPMANPEYAAKMGENQPSTMG